MITNRLHIISHTDTHIQMFYTILFPTPSYTFIPQEILENCQFSPEKKSLFKEPVNLLKTPSDVLVYIKKKKIDSIETR